MKKILNWIGATMIALYIGAFFRAYIEDHEVTANDQTVHFQCVAATGEDVPCNDRDVQFIMLNENNYVRQK
ncbi:hypothetical protein ACO0LM_22350 [Undibacterium sp. Di26W]|uniref:hypothetical protein n=1 Tax=Undibacterium sp. Di26W TaxID=3413035 RepID=UPI003BF34330